MSMLEQIEAYMRSPTVLARINFTFEAESKLSRERRRLFSYLATGKMPPKVEPRRKKRKNRR